MLPIHLIGHDDHVIFVGSQWPLVALGLLLNVQFCVIPQTNHAFLRGGIRGGFDVCKATFTKLQTAFIHVGISLDL